MLEDSSSSSTKIDFDYRKVKIKQEKPSPPPKKEKDADNILSEILPLTKIFESTEDQNSNNTGKSDENDEKKSIEPVKSSNEILAELFKVFNAAPPESLLNDDYLLKKKKKHKKEKKHKKKSKKHSKDVSDDEGSDLSEKSSERKKHKKKKHKKSSKKLDESEEKNDDNKDKDNNNDKVNNKDKVDSKDKIDSKDQIYNKDKDDSKDKHLQHRHNHHHHHHHHHQNDHHHHQKIKEEKISPQKLEESEISLSDEESLINYPKPIIVNTSIVKKEKMDNTSKNINVSNNSSSSGINNRIIIKSLKDCLKNADKEQSKRKENDKRYKKDDSSDITLSDEEDYLREKELYMKNRNHDERGSRYRDRRHVSSSRYNSRDRYRSSWRSRSRSRYRRRTRSRSRSTELMIDKKRLLEIARKNAITMFKSGSLPGTQDMSQEVKDKVVMKMRYGGKTVEELTEFCKKLSKGESLNELSSLSSNEDSDYDKHGNEKAFHHPFVLKDRGPIVMNIKNATPIPPKSAEQSKAILMQYPVSSGQMHRMTESEWVPVSPKKAEVIPATSLPPPPPQKAQPPKNVFQKPLPTEKQQPAFTPVTSTTEFDVSTVVPIIVTTTPTTTFITTVDTTPTISTNVFTTPVHFPAPVPAPVIPPPLPVPAPIPSTTMTTTISPEITLPSIVQPPPLIPLSSKESSIFPQTSQNLDVSSIITQRLNAMRKLQENPMDPEALKMMYNSQKDMSAWATSNFTPGQFTGTTGAKILTAQELTAGQQAWAKRDQLTTTVPVSGGMGMRLLQKMGWKPGEGLGKEKNGALQPLLLEVKLDKKGLLTNEEDPTQVVRPKRKKPNPPTLAIQKQALESKHPVSLLGELAAKRKWGVPYYEIVTEDGPAHQKNFIFKVVLNGIMYQPSITCNNKKKAKALAAQYCLQQIGVLSV